MIVYLWRKFGVLLLPVVENTKRADNEEGVPHTATQISRERYCLERLCSCKRVEKLPQYGGHTFPRPMSSARMPEIPFS